MEAYTLTLFVICSLVFTIIVSARIGNYHKQLRNIFIPTGYIHRDKFGNLFIRRAKEKWIRFKWGEGVGRKIYIGGMFESKELDTKAKRALMHPKHLKF